MQVRIVSCSRIKRILTLSIPNILGLDSDTRDMSRSMMDMITREPSMMFQPDVKYASWP